MIKEYYPNPIKKVLAPIKSYSSPAVYGKMANGMVPAFNDHQAKKKNITVEEFVRRDILVREKAKELVGLMIGDLVYPHTKAELEKYGPHKIVQLYRTYADFEMSDWDEDKWSFLIGARSVNDPAKYMTATPKYFTRTEPKE